MKVLVSASARFVLGSDNRLWTPNASLVHKFWARYLDVFDEVRLIVRAQPMRDVPEGWVEASGEGVSVVALPHFVGPAQFARNLVTVRRLVGRALLEREAVMLRLPCVVGSELWRQLSSRRPYGVEIVGDPMDVFAPGAVSHPLSPILHWWWPRKLRAQCAQAVAATYVTQHALQRRYPPAEDAYSTFYSSIDLGADALVSKARSFKLRLSEPLRIVTVGSLSQLYKAPDVLIEAVGRCIEQGLDLTLNLIGDGKYRDQLEAQVARLGLQKRIRFAGQLSAESVRAELDASDLFILPSRTEGLPRAMIEAMARALPCIGSRVGGIPELLSDEDLVQPGDVEGLVKRINELARHPEQLTQMSRANLAHAELYREDVLRERRVGLYRHVHTRTEQWRRCVA
ncbi:MAG: glycosyltransferase family 4 protein [Bradymonadaceae bacterium]|nr:glycosyltransferase family 4 protein [Lujinxingiaceae bacterium]